jgi:hypothetical protein
MFNLKILWRREGGPNNQMQKTGTQVLFSVEALARF